MKIVSQSIALLLVATAALAINIISANAAEPGGVLINAVTRNDSAAKESLQLAENKKALLPIVISPDASKSTREVANELAGIFEEISGAKFEVKTGNGNSGIVLGTLAQFPTPELNAALEIKNGVDGREAFAIRTSATRVLLLGATELGASHAAFRFLEVLGYRHFFPYKVWEAVPSIPDLKWARDITDRPSILSRDIWFEAGSGGEKQNQDYTDWKRHNLQAQSFVVNAGHSLDAVIKANKAEFDAHPEYYAFTGGKRDPGSYQIELGNPAVRKMVVQYARDYFTQNPNADMVSVDPADTPQFSQSPESKKLGSFSDAIFGMANEVAQMLQKEFPGKQVGLYSYSSHWDAPNFDLEPNVHVLLAGIGQGEQTPAERDQLWTQRSRNIGFYEYFSVWLWSFDKLPGSWVNDIHGAQGAFKHKIAIGATSVSAESTSTWGSNGRGYYIVNKLMWNPDIDVDKTADDFYDKAFGPAAPAMKKYYERLDPANAKFLSKHLLGLAMRDMEAASTLAADRPDVIARLDQIKMYLGYIYLDWMKNRDAAIPAVDKEKLNPQIMQHLYRISPNSLISWEMIRQQWGGNKYPGQADAPEWMTGGEYTRAEIDGGFKQIVEYFQPAQIGEAKTFSEDLVPVVWSAQAKGKADDTAKNQQSYQGAAKYYFYSLNGEPLDFQTWAGDAWGGINRFTLTDAKGTEISKGTLPNKEITDHHIEVPAPGLYVLNYNDNGSYWSISVAPGKSVTMPMGQSQDFRNSQVMQDMYFYVPKGTKKFEYFYTRTAFHPGGPHQILDPNGEIAPITVAGKEVETADINGDWASVEIPAGMDGKLWRFHQPVLGMFWFNNVPNYLAASPAALLVPRELVVKDGLTIRK